MTILLIQLLKLSEDTATHMLETNTEVSLLVVDHEPRVVLDILWVCKVLLDLTIEQERSTEKCQHHRYMRIYINQLLRDEREISIIRFRLQPRTIGIEERYYRNSTEERKCFLSQAILSVVLELVIVVFSHTLFAYKATIVTEEIVRRHDEWHSSRERYRFSILHVDLPFRQRNIQKLLRTGMNHTRYLNLLSNDSTAVDNLLLHEALVSSKHLLQRRERYHACVQQVRQRIDHETFASS